MKDRIITTNKLNKSFGGITAVDSVNLSIERGSITTIVGPNGAGKTTLFNILTGLIKPDSGSIFFEKKNITDLPVHIRSRRYFSFMTQKSSIFNNLSVYKNLSVSINTKCGSVIQNLTSTNTLNDNHRIEINNILNLVKLQKERDKLTSELSFGQRRLVEFAQALVNPNTALLLDEPTSGMNTIVINKFKNILEELKRLGKTVLIIEHNVNFAAEISDFIVVMRNGQIITSGKPGAVFREDAALNSYL